MYGFNEESPTKGFKTKLFSSVAYGYATGFCQTKDTYENTFFP